jgi:hypothetical protein
MAKDKTIVLDKEFILYYDKEGTLWYKEKDK